MLVHRQCERIEPFCLARSVEMAEHSPLMARRCCSNSSPGEVPLRLMVGLVTMGFLLRDRKWNGQTRPLDRIEIFHDLTGMPTEEIVFLVSAKKNVRARAAIPTFRNDHPQLSGIRFFYTGRWRGPPVLSALRSLRAASWRPSARWRGYPRSLRFDREEIVLKDCVLEQ
jgi:hypothetical protein